MSQAEKTFMDLIEVVRFQEGWGVREEKGHRQSFWYITNPTQEFARFPIPIRYDAGHPKSFRLRVQQLGFQWADATKAYNDHQKEIAKQHAEQQRKAEQRLAAGIRERQEERDAALQAGNTAAGKARWEKPRRYTIPVRITPEYALPLVTDNLGPSAREPFPEATQLTKAYLQLITDKQLDDFPGPIVLDWHGRLLSGHELLLAVIEADRPITVDVTHDADPDSYAALNLAVNMLTGTVAAEPEPVPADTGEDTEDDAAELDTVEDTPEPSTADSGGEPDEATVRAQRSAATAIARRRTVARLLHLYDEVPVSVWDEERFSGARLDEIEENYPGLEQAVVLANKLSAANNRGRPCFSPGPAGVFCYLVLRETPEALEEDFGLFVEGAMKGYGLTKGDPCAALHHWLYNNAKPLPGAHKRTNGAEQLMVLLKCWNAFMEDRPMRLADAAWTPDEHTVMCYRPEDAE